MSSTAPEIFVLGSSQSVASAEERANLHLDVEDMYDALALLITRGFLDEAVPLATCGRVEVYGVSPRPQRALRALRQMLARRTGVSSAQLASHSYMYRNRDAAIHLFRVAAGLDSVVYGEAQIIGQVRDALEHPRTRDTAGTLLHRLFQHALGAGKRVRTETAIGRGAVSLAGASLALLKQELGSLETYSALVLGAGDTGVLMARLLRKEGLTRLTVANRTLSKAERVARELGGQAMPLEKLPDLIRDVDIVVGAVSDRDDLVTAELLRDTLPGAPERERWFLDLAHPRNFHPDLAELPGIRLMDLDHVFTSVQAAREAREAEVPRAEAMVEEAADVLMKWVRTRQSAAILAAVREHVMQIAQEEAERHARGRSPEEREHMLRLARSLARSMLHCPTVALREADPADDEGRRLLRSATSLFGLGPELDSREAS